VHLAYLDESGTDGRSPIVMFGALIVPVGRFGHLSGLYSAAIEQIIPADKVGEFKEFHACELYKGKSAFELVDEIKRFNAIRVLLSAVKMDHLTFIYAAADRNKFDNSPFPSTSPLISAFHMCLLGVEDWATENHPQDAHDDTKLIDWNDTYLCIQDDISDKRLKDEFRARYRRLRAKHPFLTPKENRLWHAHDDLFFSDSRECLGVQMVDLCNYFVRRRLSGDPDPQNFYEIFSTQIICAKPKPEWDQYKDFFRTHESDAISVGS